MTRAVLLDMWGTIIEPACSREEYYRSRARALLEASGLEPSQEEVERAYEIYMKGNELLARKRRETLREIPARKAISLFYGAMGMAEEVKAEHLSAYARPFLELTRLTAGAGEAIGDLSRDYTLALITNVAHGRMTREALRREGILESFSAVITSYDVGYRKPHPRIFRRALEAARAGPEEAVMVGDELEDDVRGAKRVGIRAIWIRAPEEKVEAIEADAVARSMAEVPRLIREVLG